MPNEKIRVRLSPGQASGGENIIERITRNGETLPVIDKTVNILVPDKTSELTNDSGYVEDVNYVHTDNNFTNEYKSQLDGLVDIEDQIELHIGNLDNPHQVTKEQVGLGNVENIGPSNMPISGPQTVFLEENYVKKEEFERLHELKVTDETAEEQSSIVVSKESVQTVAEAALNKKTFLITPTSVQVTNKDGTAFEAQEEAELVTLKKLQAKDVLEANSIKTSHMNNTLENTEINVQSDINELDFKINNYQLDNVKVSKQVSKTEEMTKRIGIDEEGSLWSEPGSEGGIPDAPIDSKIYGRKNANWEEINETVPTDIIYNSQSIVEDNVANLTPILNTKVDKIEGKGLSDENFTLSDKTSLGQLATSAVLKTNQILKTSEMNNRVGVDETGALWYTISGGGGIPDAPSDGKTYGRKDTSWTEIKENVSDIVYNEESILQDGIANLTPILENKVDKEEGKGLSEENYTPLDKSTVEYLAENALLKNQQATKTPQMDTQVGIDENGQLWYEKGSGGSGGSGKEVDFAGTIDYNGIITSSLYPELNGTLILDINNTQYKNLVFKATDNYNGRKKTLMWDPERPVGDFGPEFTDYNTYLNYFYTENGVYCKNYEFDGESIIPIDVVEFESILSNESVYLVISNEGVIKINFNGLDHINKSIELTSTLAMSELLIEDVISVFAGDLILINNDENPFIKITSANKMVTEIYDHRTNTVLTGAISSEDLSQILDIGSSIMINVEGGF